MATMNGSARPATQETNDTDWLLGDITGGGLGAPRPNPEVVVARAKRRRYTAEYKQKILAQTDRVKGYGDIGALLRGEGLYSSPLAKWRQERAMGFSKV